MRRIPNKNRPVKMGYSMAKKQVRLWKIHPGMQHADYYDNYDEY